MINIEYLLGTINLEEDHQSRSVTDYREWKLNPLIFKKIWKVFWTPDVDLFASRISQQVPAYIAWKPGPFSKEMDVFQLSWRSLKKYVFSPFGLIGRDFRKVQVENVTIILITLAWQT